MDVGRRDRAQDQVLAQEYATAAWRSVHDGDVSKMTVAFGYLIYHVGLMGLHAPLRLVGGRDKLRNRPLPNLVAGFGVHGLFALQFMRYLTANNYWSVVHKLVF
jgi:hypothetical protein